MRHRWLVLAALVLAAGCLGGSDAGDAGDRTDAPNSTSTTSAANGTSTAGDVDQAPVSTPTWEEGQWFAYDRSGPWTEGTEGTDRLVVLEATGDGYVTGRSSRAAYAADLFWSNDPLLGPLDGELASQLDAEAGTRPPTVLDWPLEDAKTWTTTGYGSEWTFTAERVDGTEAPQAGGPGFRILGNTTGMAIEAVYAPSAGTLVSYRVTEHPSGDLFYEYTLTDQGTNHDGERWTGTRDVLVNNERWQAGGLVPPSRPVTVPEDATDLYAFAWIWNGAAVRLADPQANTRYLDRAGPETVSQGLFTAEDPIAGDWSWEAETTGNAACGDAPEQASEACGGIFVRTAVLSLENVG